VDHAAISWTLPVEVSILTLSDGLSDGLLRLMHERGSGELLRVGFGPQFTWDRLSLSPRVVGSYGRLEEELRQLDATVSAHSLAAGIDLELGYDLMGRDVLCVRGIVGAAASFHSVDGVVSPDEPDLEVEPSGTGVRLNAGLRACTGGTFCLGALVGADSQVSIDASSPDDSRSAALDSTWVMLQVSVDLGRAMW
jgi:hypothetical protein